MKEYRVKHQTVIEGKHMSEGHTVRLSDEKAKVYKSAGLIEEDVAENDEKKSGAKTENKA